MRGYTLHEDLARGCASGTGSRNVPARNEAKRHECETTNVRAGLPARTRPRARAGRARALHSRFAR